MEKTKIIIVNFIVTVLLLFGLIGYFEWRIPFLIKKEALKIENNQNILNEKKIEPTDLIKQNNPEENLNKVYETPKELFYSGDRVPGYASGEVISIDEENLILKQPASIDLRYQIFKKDISKIMEIELKNTKKEINENTEMKESPSDWSKIKKGSKINIRLDENQKRVLVLIIEKSSF